MEWTPETSNGVVKMATLLQCDLAPVRALKQGSHRRRPQPPPPLLINTLHGFDQRLLKPVEGCATKSRQ